jgi:methylated-DNA-[protein]-cysteine S-methyltransferase
VILGITFGELTNTLLGPLSFIAGDRGLLRVAFSPLQELKAELNIKDFQPSLQGLHNIGKVLTEMQEYLLGKRKSFSVQIDWDSLHGFQKNLLAYISAIPFGEVATYGQIASGIGKPGASRAVGRALSTNPMPIVIPCHRIIGADLTLHGYLGGVETKVSLLALEGHKISNNQLI